MHELAAASGAMPIDREELWPPIYWTPRGASDSDSDASASDGSSAKKDVFDLWPPMQWSPASKDTKAEARDEVPRSVAEQKKEENRAPSTLIPKPQILKP